MLEKQILIYCVCDTEVSAILVSVCILIGSSSLSSCQPLTLDQNKLEWIDVMDSYMLTPAFVKTNI